MTIERREPDANENPWRRTPQNDLLAELRTKDADYQRRAEEWRKDAKAGGVELTPEVEKLLYIDHYGRAADAIQNLVDVLEALAPTLEGIVNDGAADIQDGHLDGVTEEMRICTAALQLLAHYRGRSDPS